MTDSSASAPASAACSAMRTAWAVSLEPAPATMVAVSPTASFTARIRSTFSGAWVVGDSPVVPETTSPSLPLLTRCLATRWALSKSMEPSGRMGVTIAVSTVPKGRFMGLSLPVRSPPVRTAVRGSEPSVGTFRQ